ncbi:MAG TPA: tetratricopeptide repeat protein [Pyrinomonadaceae bacterium]|jgi:tetratricopeptide (TPR) repeat protein|nr:tetratricopeptide repeat protein [Pyrinomonadaceae bacterium]
MRKGDYLSRAVDFKTPSAALALLLVCLCYAPASVSAQQQRPKIADDVEREKKTTLPKDVDSKPAKVSPRVRRPAPPRRTAAAATLQVTLFAGASGVQIYLERADGSAEKLGTTREDGTLAVKLLRGTYNLLVARPEARAVRRQIEVSPDRTIFSLDPARGEASAQPAAVPPAAQPTVTAEEIFKRFLDPRQTEGVTLDDWRAALEQTAEAYSHNSEDPLTAAQAHFSYGQVAYLGGDYQTALNSFNNAALAVPNSALAFYGLGNAYLASRKAPEAARAYQQALKIRPNMALALKGMGDALYSQGKSKEAIDYYARALALGYDSPALKLSMARSLNKERRWQEALDLTAGLSKSNPSAEVFLTLGDAYAGLKQNREAYGAYRQASETDSRSALALYKLGEVSFQLRDYAAAREALEKALALDPEGKSFDAARARDLLGKSAAKLGRK